MGIFEIPFILQPMPSKIELLDLQFIEARHLLINLAAFLDRLDRYPGEADYRYSSLVAALPILLDPGPNRAKAILEAFSDHSIEIPTCAPFQGATGAAKSA